MTNNRDQQDSALLFSVRVSFFAPFWSGLNHTLREVFKKLDFKLVVSSTTRIVVLVVVFCLSGNFCHSRCGDGWLVGVVKTSAMTIQQDLVRMMAGVTTGCTDSKINGTAEHQHFDDSFQPPQPPPH